MIIRRYLGSQVLATTTAVAGLLTVILLSSRVMQFFERAVNGKIAVNLLTAVLWYRLPGFLELILPLGLFMGLLLALGRLYLDNEMAILSAAGVGPARLLRWLTPSILLVTVLTAMLSLWLSPRGNAEADRLYAEQANRNTFELIQPGRFQRVGERMLYADLGPDKSVLRDVHMLEVKPGAAGEGDHQIILKAREGRRVSDPELGDAIELRQGERWDVRAGDGAYQRIHFERYRLRFHVDEAPESQGLMTSVHTPALLMRLDEPAARAEWGWRWSMICLVPVVALLALPLARVNPRQGRYLKLLPSIVLYLSYVLFLVAIKNGVEKGELHAASFWGVHALYLTLALVLLAGRPRRSKPA